MGSSKSWFMDSLNFLNTKLRLRATLQLYWAFSKSPSNESNGQSPPESNSISNQVRLFQGQQNRWRWHNPWGKWSSRDGQQRRRLRQWLIRWRQWKWRMWGIRWKFLNIKLSKIKSTQNIKFRRLGKIVLNHLPPFICPWCAVIVLGSFIVVSFGKDDDFEKCQNKRIIIQSCTNK